MFARNGEGGWVGGFAGVCEFVIAGRKGVSGGEGRVAGWCQGEAGGWDGGGLGMGLEEWV